MCLVTALHISPGIQSYFFVLLPSVRSNIGSIPWVPSQTQAAVLQHFCLDSEQSKRKVTWINHAHNLIGRLQSPTWMRCCHPAWCFICGSLCQSLSGWGRREVDSLTDQLDEVNLPLRRGLSSMSKMKDHIQMVYFSDPNPGEALCQYLYYNISSNIFIISNSWNHTIQLGKAALPLTKRAWNLLQCPYHSFLLLLGRGAMPCSLWDLSSPTRDWTPGPSSESTKS